MRVLLAIALVAGTPALHHTSAGTRAAQASLLASLQFANVTDYFAHFNLYPNAIVKMDPGLGFFFAMTKENQHFVTGISFTRSLGFGLGTGNL